MEIYLWIFFLFIALLALKQLASILRSVQSTEVMMKRLLAHQGVHWEVATEPSEKVKELALNAGNEIAAIQAYREQTGLGLKEARTVVEELSRSKQSAA